MLKAPRILVRTFALAAGAAVCATALSACGQRGPLYMPSEPAAANRASLPDSLRPDLGTPERTPPAAPASSTPAR